MLERYKGLLRLVVEQSTDLIVMGDSEGKIEYVSPAVVDKLGFTREELLGRPSAALFHPDCMAEVESLRQHACQGENIPKFTARVCTKSGSYLWIQGTIRVVKDSNGQAIRLVGVWHDVTELKTLAERLNQAIEVAGIGHWEWDLIQDKVFWSDKAREICGMEQNAEVTLETIVELMGAESNDSLMASADRLIASKSYKGETTIRRPDGSRRILEYHGEVIYAAGNPAKVMGIIHDITDKRMMEQALMESEKLALAGQLAAGIAHEIRNPLAAIKGLSQLMKEWLPQEKCHLAEVMVSEIDRINSVIGELLLSTKPHISTLSTVSLSDSIGDVVRLLTPEGHKAGVVIDVSIPPQIEVLGDVHQLKQVWINFLLNAIDAMPDGGHIYISAERHPDSIEVRFRDEGVGIASERLAQLGQPFYTTKDGGTGLGLLVCRNILHNHEGTMSIQSEVGTGTTVRVKLPLASPQASEIA